MKKTGRPVSPHVTIYSFPIGALWAAFDYWHVLFPDENVEFRVTCLYQLGAVVTVPRSASRAIL